jgi:hypothetical protein
MVTENYWIYFPNFFEASTQLGWNHCRENSYWHRSIDCNQHFHCDSSLVSSNSHSVLTLHSVSQIIEYYIFILRNDLENDSGVKQKIQEFHEKRSGSLRTTISLNNNSSIIPDKGSQSSKRSAQLSGNYSRLQPTQDIDNITNQPRRNLLAILLSTDHARKVTVKKNSLKNSQATSHRKSNIYIFDTHFFFPSSFFLK